MCFHLSTSLRVSGASFHYRDLSTALWTSLMTLEMCPFHHQNHPPLPLLTAHLGVSGQPPPSAWPSKIHYPHVAQQLFQNHNLRCPTPHHLQPLLLSHQHSAGYLGPFVFTNVQATTSTTSPCLPRGTPSKASPHLCSVQRCRSRPGKAARINRIWSLNTTSSLTSRRGIIHCILKTPKRVCGENNSVPTQACP